MQYGPFFHLPLSVLQSDQYALSGSEKTDNLRQNAQVFDINFRNICLIANPKVGGERAVYAAQAIY